MKSTSQEHQAASDTAERAKSELRPPNVLDQLLHDANELARRQGGAGQVAARRLNAMECAVADLERRNVTLEAKVLAAEHQQQQEQPLDVDEVVNRLQHRCVCVGDMALLRAVLTRDDGGAVVKDSTISKVLVSVTRLDVPHSHPTPEGSIEGDTLKTKRASSPSGGLGDELPSPKRQNRSGERPHSDQRDGGEKQRSRSLSVPASCRAGSRASDGGGWKQATTVQHHIESRSKGPAQRYNM